MLAAFTAVGAVALAVMPRALVGVFYDDGIYLVLARSLAEGHGYHLLHLPGAPAAVHYPFGYPLFLAALWKLWPAFPANVIMFRAANAVLLGLFAALTAGHVGVRLAGRQWLATLVVILAATAIPLVTVASVLFAEPLFLALAAASCWMAEAASRADAGRAVPLAAAAGLLAGASGLTRSIGIAVVFGVVVSLILARRLRLAAIAGLVAVTALAPWSLWVAAHHGAVDPLIRANYGTYGDLLAQAGWGWLTLGSLGDLTGPLSVVLLPPPPLLRIVMAVPLFALLLYGVAVLVRTMPSLGWTLAAYLVIVALWPYGPDRFLWAVLPWLALALAFGVQRAWRRGPRLLHVGVMIVLMGVAAGFGRFQALGYLRGSATGAQRAISATMSQFIPWIEASTPPDAVIAGEDEALLWLYTGRRAVPNYLWRVRGRGAEGLPADSLHAFFARSGVTHVILSGPGSDAARGLDALLGGRPGYLTVVRAWPGPMLAFRVSGR